MKRTDILEATDACKGVVVSDETKSRILNKEEGLKKQKARRIERKWQGERSLSWSCSYR